MLEYDTRYLGCRNTAMKLPDMSAFQKDAIHWLSARGSRWARFGRLCGVCTPAWERSMYSPRACPAADLSRASVVDRGMGAQQQLFITHRHLDTRLVSTAVDDLLEVVLPILFTAWLQAFQCPQQRR